MWCTVHIIYIHSSVVLVPQFCLTLFKPMDCGPQGSSVHGFCRQEYWRRLPFLSPEVLSNPGVEPGSPALQADSLPTELHRRSSLSFSCPSPHSTSSPLLQSRRTFGSKGVKTEKVEVLDSQMPSYSPVGNTPEV